MINRELFELIKRNMGVMSGNGATDEWIDKFSRELEVELPLSYKRFLKEMGFLGVSFYNVKGIERADLSGMFIFTEKYREKFSLPKEYVVVSERSTRNPDTHFITCLDTGRMVNDECPVIKYDAINNIVSDYKSDFDEAFEDGLLEIYNERLLPRLQENPDEKQEVLPLGLGYKACWLTIIGSNRNRILEAFQIHNSVMLDYKKGIEEEISGKNKILVTADYDGKNYVLFSGTTKIFDSSFIDEYCSQFETVYGYITHRVSEVHGFYKASNGQIDRLYYKDENEVRNIGESLPEEKKNKIVLPNDIVEVMDRKFTRVNETVIYELAMASSKIQKDLYPYEDVVIGDFLLDE